MPGKVRINGDPAPAESFRSSTFASTVEKLAWRLGGVKNAGVVVLRRPPAGEPDDSSASRRFHVDEERRAADGSFDVPCPPLVLRLKEVGVRVVELYVAERGRARES